MKISKPVRFKFLRTLGVSALTFGIGAIVGVVFSLHHARFLSTSEFLRELGPAPRGTLGAGSYWIAAEGGKRVLLEVDVNASASDPGTIQSVDLSNGALRRGCYFEYQFRDRYDLPEVYLSTGPSGKSNSWCDIGLTGSFATETVGDRDYAHIGGGWVPIRFGRYTFVHGKAVLLGEGRAPAPLDKGTVTALGGERYRYDPREAKWKPVVAK